MAMCKRSVTLSVQQATFLKKESARLGIPISELLRRLIDEHIAKQKQKDK